MPIPETALIVDLRVQELRFHEPLERLVPNEVKVLTLGDIEVGRHGLSGEPREVVVICERGIRSSLAAKYLQADGVRAGHYPGGVPALRRALTTEHPS